MELTEEGRADPVVGGLPPVVRALQWHQDTFDLPAGAVRLMRSALYDNQAFRYGEASLAAPFDYVSIVWAMLFGFVVFGDIPTWLVISGAACIVASSIYIARREALLARERSRAAARVPER